MIKIFSPLIIVMVLLFTGCTQNEEIDLEQEQIIEEEIEYTPEQGGTLHISMRVPHTLNPILNEDVTVDNALKLVFEQLYILDENLKPVPNLAQSAEFSEDGTYAIITLRNDILWSDGTPMRANDLIFTLDTIKNNPNSIYAEVVQDISSYTLIDPLTVRVNFNKSSRGQGYMFLFPIIPQHYYEGHNNSSSQRNMEPLGNGPFMFESYTIVKEMKLVASPTSFKKPYIENVNILIISDIETDFHALGHGIIEVLHSNIIDFGRYGGSRELNITQIPKNHFDFIGFNFRNPVFNDKRVRQAVAHLIPKDEFIDTIYLGQAVRASSPINPTSWLYEEGTSQYEHNLEIARNLIIEAGYVEIDDNGTLGSMDSGEPEPLIFNILVNEENVERVQIANSLRQSLETIGVGVNLMVYDFENYTNEINNRNFDLVLAGFNLSISPDLGFALHSSQIGASNFFSYSSDTLDTLLATVVAAPNEATYIEATSNLQKYISEELPIISIAFRTSVLLTDTHIKGDLSPSLNNIYQNVSQWFIIEE